MYGQLASNQKHITPNIVLVTLGTKRRRQLDLLDRLDLLGTN
jgi:hypothetical protein